MTVYEWTMINHKRTIGKDREGKGEGGERKGNKGKIGQGREKGGDFPCFPLLFFLPTLVLLWLNIAHSYNPIVFCFCIGLPLTSIPDRIEGRRHGPLGSVYLPFFKE